MSEKEKQESQKTVVAFVAGLLIGGLLVWVFSSGPEDMTTDEADNGDTSEEVTTPSTENEDGDTTDATNDTTDDGEDENTTATPQTPELPTGDGEIEVNDQAAGTRVTLASATFPSDEGWIGVRDYVDGQLVGLLGVARYSKEQGLIPQGITLQRATEAGKTYAVVFYSESGDRVFNLADDVQVNGIMETFTAQ